MYVKNNIAYADKPEQLLRVTNVRPLDDYCLRVRFSTGEVKICDCKPMLDFPAFRPLNDKRLFDQVYVDYGTVTWDETLDIASEALYTIGGFGCATDVSKE